MEMMLAAMSVIWSGVCDRYPRVRIGFMESGGGWIAPWLDLMDRHFDASELGGVVGEIDKLFSQRFDALVNSLELGKPPRGTGGSGHGGGRRPRHLH